MPPLRKMKITDLSGTTGFADSPVASPARARAAEMSAIPSPARPMAPAWSIERREERAANDGVRRAAVIWCALSITPAPCERYRGSVIHDYNKSTPVDAIRFGGWQCGIVRPDRTFEVGPDRPWFAASWGVIR